MVNQPRSIIEHEKAVHPVAEKRSLTHQELFGELTERALRFPITEEMLFSALAEYLAAKGIGFAVAAIQTAESYLEVKALFAPNGTDLTPYITSSFSKTDSVRRVRVIKDLSENLKNGEVLFMSSLDEVVIEGGEVLHKAFGKEPIMITRLPGSRELNEILILCGKSLDDKWMLKTRELVGKLSSALDISRLRADLSESKDHQDWLFTYSKEGHLLLDASGEIHDANPKAAELLGKTREELISMNIVDVIPESKDLIDPSNLNTQVSPNIIEVDYPSQGEGVRYLHVEHHAVTVDCTSKTLVKISDLTERWRHEEMIRQLGTVTAEVNANPAVGICLLDSQGNFVHLNDTAIEILGYCEGDLHGKPWNAIVPEDQRYKVSQANLRRIRGESGRYDIQLVHMNGDRLDMLVSESPYHEDGRYAGTFIFLTDLTPLRKAEAIVLRQNWELQRVVDRFVTQFQKDRQLLHTVDVQVLLQNAGDELDRAGMVCLVATFDPNEPYWNVQYVTPRLRKMEFKGQIPESDPEPSIHMDLNDPSLALLESGEVIYVEYPSRSVEGLISQISPFNSFLEEVKTRPRILAPLKTIDRLIGVLVLCGENLTSEDTPTITTFANHLSIALEKSKLLRNTLVQARLGRALADIVLASSQQKDVSRLMHRAGELILEAVHLRFCTFCIIGENNSSLSVLLSVAGKDHFNIAQLPDPGTPINLNDFPIVEGVLKTGRKAILPDSRPLFFGSEEKFDQIKPSPTLLLPMKSSNQCVGLVSFPLENPEKCLSQDEQLFLQTSVDQLSLAMEELQQAIIKDLKSQLERDLSSLCTQILASRNLDEVVQRTIQGVANLLPCHFVCLTSFDHCVNTAKVLGVIGGDEETIKSGDVKSLDEWDDIEELMSGREVYYGVSNELHSGSSIASRLFRRGSRSWLSLPLYDQKEVVGSLSIASRQSDLNTREHMDIVTQIQKHLAIALTNARDHTHLMNQVEEMAGLIDLSFGISEGSDLRSLLRMAVQRSAQILNATMGAIFLVDKSAEEIMLVAEYGLPGPPANLRLQAGRGFAGKVWEKKGAIILNKLRDLGDPKWLEACYSTGSAIGVPLMWEDEVRGVLALFIPGEENRFSVHDIDILSKIAAQVLVRIENLEEMEKTTRSVNQLRVVNDVARRISTILVEDLLFTEIVRRVAHGLNLDLVILFLVEKDDITEAASYYLPQDMYGIWDPIKLKISSGGVIGWVASEGQPILVPDVSTDPNYLAMVPMDIRVQSAVGLPLKLKGEVTGILLVGSEKLGAFDKADIDALLALGAHISTCIENARLYEETKAVQHRLAESEKLRALGLVTGGIAHDFNNVLSVILSRTELALKQTDDEQVRRQLDQVIASAKEGGETLHRLEGFACTEKDKTDFVGVDINQIVQEAIEICKPKWKDQTQAEGVNLQIITELHADQPILGVPNELREVLVNLIFNAMEAIPAGGNITLYTENKDNGISLILSDDGVGMTPDMRQHVFVPFFTTKPGRVGLGLSVCYGILQRHGGTIDIQSEIGEGTTIKVWLPTYAKIGLEDESTKDNMIPALVEPAIILVVEDEKSILNGLVETFVDAGHKVLAASNGLEAFELFLEAGKLDIVFTDLSLPKLSGWELIEQLRAFDQKLPIVIFSGWGDVINPIKVRQHGIAKVIRKPFEMAKLHSTLYEVLAMRKKLDSS
jgi:PAS domain S-box-containing protein